MNSLFRLLLSSLLVLAAIRPADVAGQNWNVSGGQTTPQPGDGLSLEKRVLRKEGDNSFFGGRTLRVVWFDSRHFQFRIIDNGAAEMPRYSDLEEAVRKNGCLAGCNGGFFLKDYQPSGLMISGGIREGTWGTGSSLVSGVLMTNQKQVSQLLRRAEYRNGSASELVQAGPFLVDQGAKVRGLSRENARPRTFALHDGRNLLGLGISDSLTLDELGEILAKPNLFGSVRIQRALNLDGGSSTGLFYEPADGSSSGVSVEPFKRVRNFVAIAPLDSGRKQRPLRAIPVSGR